ncbi:hypothetical protein Droror1_Dr00025688, partial [Drosera rotundifolia]
MGRSPCYEENGMKKGLWTPEENKKLLDYIEKNNGRYFFLQVTTYALFIEDVMEVISDIVIVNEAAASRIQRVTK